MEQPAAGGASHSVDVALSTVAKATSSDTIRSDNNADDGNDPSAGDEQHADARMPALVATSQRVRVAIDDPNGEKSEEETEDFGITPGTLEVVETWRRLWVHPTEPPLSRERGEPSPIVEELTRSWRVLRLKPAHPTDGLVKKRELSAETTLLKNYEPRVELGEPTFPTEISVPAFLQPRVAVDDATPFLVSPRLRFALGMLEPLYCRLVLYDVQLGCRVSEEFTFTLPAGALRPRKPARGIFFSLSRNQLQHLYVVLKVSKGLLGDADTATAPYCTPEKFASEADQQRLAERASECQRRLGRYTQPLAWGAIPLGEGRNRCVTLYRQRLTLSDEQRLAMIVDAARGGLKEKIVPAMCELDIERIDEQRYDESKFQTKSLKTLSKDGLKLPSAPILELLDPFTPQTATEVANQERVAENDETDDAESSFYACREVQPLCHPAAYVAHGLCGSGPFAVSYLHAMYVYPLHVDKFPFRNLAIRVQLLQKEVEFVCGMDEFETQNAVVPAFYNVDREIVSSAVAHVNYHQKNPQFETEIKLSLPQQLTLSHHLLFTFFHVHCKKLQPGQQQQELVGCCALPILSPSGALLEDSEYILNIIPPSTASKNSTSGGIISLPPGYVDAARSAPAHDTSRTTFAFRTRALSSVRSQDPHVASFMEPFQSKPLKHLDAPSTEEVTDRIHRLRLSPPLVLRHFFLPVTRFLFAYMRFAATSALRQAAFQTLLIVFDKASRNSERFTKSEDPMDILQLFVTLAFDDQVIERCAPRIRSAALKRGDDEPSSTLQAVAIAWLHTVRCKNSDEHTTVARLSSLSYAKIFLQLILKSLALERTSSGSFLPLATSHRNTVLLEDLFIELVEQVTNTGNKLSYTKPVNMGLAALCRGLFLVTTSALPMRVIHYYLGWTQRLHGDVNVTVHLLFPFLNSLIEFEFFAIVNAFHSPLASGERHGPRRGAWLARLVFERLLSVVDDQVEDRIRSEALRLLRRMFVLQVYNPRHQHIEQQELIALMYFPMIPAIAKFTTDGKLLATSADSMDSSESDRASVFRKELLICVAHLLSSVSLPYLSWYFRQSALVVGVDTIERDRADAALSPTASLLHYRRLVEETKLRPSDARRQSLIQRNLDKAFAVSSPSSRATVYDEVRVHACLSLVRQMVEVFLMEELALPSMQVLSPDLVARDVRLSLQSLETSMKQRESRHRGLSLGQDAGAHHRISTSAGCRSPNAKGNPSSGSFYAGSTTGPARLTAQKSLPRNWGKNYAIAQQRASLTTSSDATKSSSHASCSLSNGSGSTSKKTPDDNDGDSAGDDYESHTKNLYRLVAGTTLKAIRTAVDQFEWVLRIIESPLDYRASARRSHPGKITMDHAFTLLAAIVDIFFLLMKRASSIACLCTASESEIDEDVDETADCFLADLFRQLQEFLSNFQRALFATRIAGLPLIHDQSRIVLLVTLSATAKLASVRQLAAAFLCKLMRVCYEQTGSFLLIKRPLLKVFCANFFSTSALQISLDALRDAIDLWRQQAMSEHETRESMDHTFELQLCEMLNGLTSQIKVFELWHGAMTEPEAVIDVEELEEGLLRVAQSVSSFWLLDVKLQWTDALIQLHAARKHYAEATCCTLEAIAFKEAAATAERSWQNATPEDALPSWLVMELRNARDLAQKAQWIEKVVEIDERLLLALRKSGRFAEYRETLRHLDSMIQLQADNSDHSSSSQLLAFYRVVLAGDCVPLGVATHEYVYKRSKFMSLGEFVGEMKAMLRARFPTCERVDVVPESKPMPSLERNPNVVFMRVTSLDLLPEEKHGETQDARFLFSTPFTLSGGSSYGKTAEQMKRVVYLSTARTFPCVTSRQVVVQRREEVRCPIDNAMDDIRKRCGLLQDEINKEGKGRTDLKTLTLVLKGSVDTHVHGGIPEVIDAFLAKPSVHAEALPTLVDASGHAMDEAKSTDKREELADLLVEFLELCWVCLLISRQAFRRISSPPSSSSVIGETNGAQVMPRIPPRASTSTTTRVTSSSLARLLDSVGLSVVDNEMSSSPLQAEFERSFATLIDHLRLKVPFSYPRDGDLVALHGHVQTHTRGRMPASKPSLSSLVLASSTPPPPPPPVSPPVVTSSPSATMLMPPPTMGLRPPTPTT